MKLLLGVLYFFISASVILGENILANGNFETNGPVPYAERLEKAGFQILNGWPSGWLPDPDSAPGIFKREVHDASLSVSNSAGETIFYAANELVPQAYELRFQAQAIDANSQIRVIAYQYGEQWKWLGMKTAKQLSPTAAPTIFSVKVFNSDPATKIMRIGFAIRGAVAISNASLVKIAATAQIQTVDLKNGWKVEYKDGARGAVEYVPPQENRANGGLKIRKDNGAGYIKLTAIQPLRLEDGEKYTYRISYHSRNAGILSQLLLRLSSKDDDNLPMPYGLFNYMAFNHIVNSIPGEWKKRIMNFECGSPGTDVNLQNRYLAGARPTLLLHGNPCTVLINQAEVYPARRHNRDERLEYQDVMDNAEVLAALKTRQPATMKIQMKHDTPKLIVNDQPVAPAMYMSSENNKLVGDFGGFDAAGVALQIVSVKLTDRQNPGDSVWRADGSYDFAKIDEQLLAVLRKNPNAKLLIQLSINPPPEWSFAHPEECWMNVNRTRYYTFPWTPLYLCGASNDMDEIRQKGGFPMVSYHSKKWRDLSSKVVRDVASYIKGSPFCNAVSGFFFFSGIDGRLQPSGNDYSATALTGFKEYLQNKYGSIHAVSKAWNRSLKSFDDIDQLNFEGFSAVFSSAIKQPYTDNLAAIDFKRYHFEDIWALVDCWAATVKDVWDYDVITCAYRDFDRDFLQTKSLDICGNDLHYMLRPAGYSGSIWYPTKTGARPKMWFMDLDLRSYAGPQIPSEEYEQLVGAELTPERWKEMHNKLVGVCLAGDNGFWYYDMLAYFQDKKIMDEIARTKKIATDLVQRPSIGSVAEVAVIVSSQSKFYSNILLNSYNGTLCFYGINYVQGMALATSGVPHDYIYIEDLITMPDLSKYKMFIFSNIAHLSDEQREFIETHLKKGKRTLVWLYDTGYIGSNGKDASNISKLTGMNTKTKEGFSRNIPEMLPPAKEYPLQVQPFISGNEFIYFNFLQHGIGSGTVAPPQLFHIVDPNVVALAKYKENGKIAIGARNFPDWTSIYIAAPAAFSNDMFAAIASRAGAFAYGAPGQYGTMNDRFISLHALRSGSYVLNFPKGRSILRDAFSGKEIAKNAVSHSLDLEAGKTYWFFFE